MSSRNRLSYATLSGVAFLHVILILFLFVAFKPRETKPKEKWIELVPLGNLNPQAGIPTLAKTVSSNEAFSPSSSSSRTQPRSTAPASQPPQQQQVRSEGLNRVTPPQAQKVEHKIESKREPQIKPQMEQKIERSTASKPSQPSRPIEVSTRLVTRPVRTTQTTKPIQTALSTQPTANSNLNNTAASSHSESRSSQTASQNSNTAESNVNSPVSGGEAPQGGTAGGTGSGVEGSPDGVDSEQARYHALIKDAIWRRWQRPQKSLADTQKLETYISVRVERDGTLQFIEISNSSGDVEMDNSVQKAAESVGKLSEPLPPSLGTSSYEVTIQFKLE